MRHDEELNDATLRDLAQRLGGRAAERLDVELTARAVVTRLRHLPRMTARSWVWIQPAWLRIAAAAVIVLGAGLVVRAVSRPTSSAAPSAVGLAGAELNDLSAEQLQELLQAVGQPRGDREAVSPQDVGLDDLSAPQLRVLLTSLEG